jgi:Fe2+ or Zn2+ uptake regulation protein
MTTKQQQIPVSDPVSEPGSINGGGQYMVAALQDQGHRVTGPRLSVIDVIKEKSAAFSAETLSEELPRVGRATVYRTLKLLLETGVVCKLQMPAGGPRYSLARVEHHHHTVCLNCGRVQEFQDATIERLMRAIGSEVEGDIVGHRIEIDVLCERCKTGDA